jgi:P pilus assembly chaperone PapD
MKNCTLIIFALLAVAVFVPPLASALTVTVTQVRSQVQDTRSAIVVTLSNSRPASRRSAESIAASAKSGIAFLVCDLPAGIYSALVLAGE